MGMGGGGNSAVIGEYLICSLVQYEWQNTIITLILMDGFIAAM